MPFVGNSWGDMELVELNEGLGRYFGTDSGLLVVSAPKSDAFKLQDGDVIQSIDGREPTSVGHALRILASYQAGEELELRIMRDKRRQTLSIEMPNDRTSFVVPEPPPAQAPRACNSTPWTHCTKNAPSHRKRGQSPFSVQGSVQVSLRTKRALTPFSGYHARPCRSPTSTIPCPML